MLQSNSRLRFRVRALGQIKGQYQSLKSGLKSGSKSSDRIQGQDSELGFRVRNSGSRFSVRIQG
jgi:hypothetical protein